MWSGDAGLIMGRVTKHTSQFASNLKNLRKEKKWSQAKAAEKITDHSGELVSKARYDRWENGNAEPPYSLLLKITEVFTIDDLYLFLGKLITLAFFLLTNLVPH